MSTFEEWLESFKRGPSKFAIEYFPEEYQKLVAIIYIGWQACEAQMPQRINTEIRRAVEIIVQHRLLTSDLIGYYGICSCGKDSELVPVDFETQQDYIDHLQAAIARLEVESAVERTDVGGTNDN